MLIHRKRTGSSAAHVRSGLMRWKLIMNEEASSYAMNAVRKIINIVSLIIIIFAYHRT